MSPRSSKKKAARAEGAPPVLDVYVGLLLASVAALIGASGKRARPPVSSDSGGNRQERYVVRTRLKLGTKAWPIELTLSNRDNMGFRLLIGREAIRRRYIVDPARSFVVRKKAPKSAGD